MPRNVAIIGVGQTNYTTLRKDVTYPELVFEAVAKALVDANMTIDEVEAVAFSLAPSSLIGVDAVERWCIDAVGARNKPFLRVNTGGATGGSAAQAGYFHIASGLFNTVLVVGAEKQGDTPDTQLILNKIWDPRFELDIALNAINMSSFQAVRHMEKYGTTEEHLAKVSVRAHGNALSNPHAHIKKAVSIEDVLASRIVCWPLKLLDCCPRSSGACAVIMVSEERAKKLTQTPVWIRGLGATTNTYYMGDKMSTQAFNDHGDWDELALASQHAYQLAGITDPQKEVDVAEIYGPFTSLEIAAVEALGFCPKGQGGRFEEEGFFNMTGELPVNPSGGALCSNPIAVTGLARVAEAALQIAGKAGDRQVKGAKTAVATAIGGSLQFHTALVLSANL